MKTIEEKKKDRFDFMKAIYEISEGSYKPVDTYKIGETLNFEEKYRQTIFQYLLAEGLINEHGGGIYKSARLTHNGIKEVEEALSSPDKPTEHFPAINYINNHYHIEGNSQSNIQLGNYNTASLEIASKSEKTAYETLIPLLHQFLKELDDEREEKAELNAELQTLEAQLTSPKPKSKVLELTFQSMKELIVGVGKEAIKDSILYQKITYQIDQLLS